MWCPSCKGEFREGIQVCPQCQVPLVETLEEDQPKPETVEMAFLMSFQDQKELGMATALLDRAGIPYVCKEPGSGEYLRIVTGENMFGTELYVDKRFTHRALRLLRQFDRDAMEPYSDDEMEQAFDEYMAENPEDTEAEPDDAPASPEGYRIAWGFIAIFAGLILVPLLIRVIRSLLLA